MFKIRMFAVVTTFLAGHFFANGVRAEGTARPLPKPGKGLAASPSTKYYCYGRYQPEAILGSELQSIRLHLNIPSVVPDQVHLDVRQDSGENFDFPQARAKLDFFRQSMFGTMSVILIFVPDKMGSYRRFYLIPETFIPGDAATGDSKVGEPLINRDSFKAEFLFDQKQFRNGPTVQCARQGTKEYAALEPTMDRDLVYRDSVASVYAGDKGVVIRTEKTRINQEVQLSNPLWPYSKVARLAGQQFLLLNFEGGNETQMRQAKLYVLAPDAKGKYSGHQVHSISFRSEKSPAILTDTSDSFLFYFSRYEDNFDSNAPLGRPTDSVQLFTRAGATSDFAATSTVFSEKAGTARVFERGKLLTLDRRLLAFEGGRLIELMDLRGKEVEVPIFTVERHRPYLVVRRHEPSWRKKLDLSGIRLFTQAADGSLAKKSDWVDFDWYNWVYVTKLGFDEDDGSISYSYGDTAPGAGGRTSEYVIRVDKDLNLKSEKRQ